MPDLETLYYQCGCSATGLVGRTPHYCGMHGHYGIDERVPAAPSPVELVPAFIPVLTPVQQPLRSTPVMLAPSAMPPMAPKPGTRIK